MSIHISADTFVYDLRLVRSRLLELIRPGQMVVSEDLEYCYSVLNNMIRSVEDATALVQGLESTVGPAAYEEARMGEGRE